jgi:hypothetical protein
MGARTGIRPGGGVESVLHRDRHQSVIARVVLDLVDAVAEAVMGVELGRVAIGVKTPADGLGGAGERSQAPEWLFGPAGPFPVQAFDKDLVLNEDVVATGLRLTMSISRAATRLPTDATMPSSTPMSSSVASRWFMKAANASGEVFSRAWPAAIERPAYIAGPRRTAARKAR